MSRLVLLLVLPLAACSLTGIDTNFPLGSALLDNRTSETIYALAVDTETAALIDIADVFEITDDDRQSVAGPGETTAIDVEGYDPGDDVVVFVYRVQGTEARYATTVSVDSETFEEEGVVTVRRL